MLSREDYRRIRMFVYRNARPLDLYRWQYHFEQGTYEHVIYALSAYQNEDGGFGNALEADAWNPLSSPIQTGTAVSILMETGFNQKNHPLPWGILQYLDSGADMENDRWMSVVPSNDDYPHAPWWQSGSQSTSHSEFNPTAMLAGFALYFAPRDSLLFKKCKRIALELIETFLMAPELDMHPLLCVESLTNWIKLANLQDFFAVEALEKEILRQASRLIQRDKDNWSGYACRPSEFIHSPSHPLYSELKEITDKELDWLLETRSGQGVWNITWGWEGYEKAFAISENWWKTDIILRNMRFLKAFGHMEKADGFICL